jgi:ABC-type uncharacterized transport system substrate-binding protein
MSANARRRFLAATGATLAAPLMLRAQGRASYRIGLLPEHEGAYLAWLHEAMRGQGWREGREFVLVQPGLSFGAPPEDAAQRAVSERPDIILSVGTQYTLAAQRLTSAIPIVVWACGYPVETGIALSLARPGKNVTGNTLYAGTSIWSKLLELLRDMRPEARRVGVLMCYVPPFHPQVETDLIYRDLRHGADRLGMEVHFAKLAGAPEVDTALRELADYAPDAVFLTTGAGVWPVREKVLGFALARRWPTIADTRWAPEDALQPLMNYSPSLQVLIRQAAQYLVRILRGGASAAQLPIQQPAKFDLTVNVRTAKALGISVPPTLLVRADQVIE